MSDTLTKEERAHLSIIELCGPYAGELVRALNTIDALEAERDKAISDITVDAACAIRAAAETMNVHWMAREQAEQDRADLVAASRALASQVLGHGGGAVAVERMKPAAEKLSALLARFPEE